MAFPDGIVTVPCRAGRLITQLGNDAQMDIILTPTERVVHAATGTVLSDMLDEAQAAGGQLAEFALPAVDQAGFIGADGLPIERWSIDMLVIERRYERIPDVPESYRPEVVAARRTYRRTLQPLLEHVADGYDTDLVPINGAPSRPLGPLWLGADEADVPTEANVWIDNSDPTRWVFKNRSVDA